MSIQAIFLDFYGTLVHEDDDIIPLICEKIKETAAVECDISDISRYWWNVFSRMFQNSYGESFKSQRELNVISLTETIAYFKSNLTASEINQEQFNHWCKPKIYEDTIDFLNELNRDRYQVYILSNIDTSDVLAAVDYHRLQVKEIITSEDVRSYKPRPELFLEALQRCRIPADQVLHIGDSYMSDVAGANNVGIKTVWLNRMGKKQPEGPEPDFICNDLIELKDVVNGIESGRIVV